MVKILTSREKEIINKKINGISLTQNESNILSKSIRPKLREVSEINDNIRFHRNLQNWILIIFVVFEFFVFILYQYIAPFLIK